MIPKGSDKKPLATANPVDGLDQPKGALGKLIGNTKPKKAPLNLTHVDRAAAALNSGDRAYFDFLRFTGLRKDEANRLRWQDINFEEGYFHCRGTKTDEADAYLPLAPALIKSLRNTSSRVRRNTYFLDDRRGLAGKGSTRAADSSRRSSG